ncbi:MAG: type and secretion system protein, partial [Lacunisphaera sp.]|nr:type and secretion system protein [Lacunisphaera sp.]
MPSFRPSAFVSAGFLLLALASPVLQAQSAEPPPFPATSAPTSPGPTAISAPTSPGPTATPARSIQTSASGTVGPIKFGDITTDGALDMLERWSGRTVLRPKDLPAVSLAFSLNQKMTKEDAQSALESVLTLNGIAVTPLGDRFLKVTPLATARSEAPDFIDGSTLKLTPSGHIASKIFQLQFLRIGEFMPQITGILNAGAASPPLLFEKANAALVTDSVSNLQRIETLVNRLDQPSLSGLSPKFFKVQNTTASELVTKLQSLLNGPSGTQLGTGTIFQADDRTNQIIVLSDPRQHAFFEELISKLDIGGESSMRQEVISLKHATATEVATILTSLITGQVSAARTANQTSQTQAAARNSASAFSNLTNRNGGPNGQPNGVNGNNQNAGNQAAQAQAAQAQAQARAAAAAAQYTMQTGTVLPGFGAATGAAALQQFSAILTIVPDDRSNSLVVSGTVDDMRLIKDLVAHLDVLLAQVRIEVVIA